MTDQSERPMRLTTARRMSCRLLSLRILSVAASAAALVVPGALAAQEPQQELPQAQEGTHVVRPGDTLWDLAGFYLNDPFLWPEIYRINTDVIEDPHWIFPGEVLRIPGRFVAAGPTPDRPGLEGEAPALRPPDVVAVEDDDEPVFVRTLAGPTIFQRQTRAAPAQPTRRPPVDLGPQPRPAVRAGEFHAAPYADRRGGPRNPGLIVSRADIPGITRAADRTRYQIGERVHVRPPRGGTLDSGQVLISYRLGPDIPGRAQIVIPTGVLVVEAPQETEVVIARIVNHFGEIELGHRVMPMDTFDLAPDVYPVPVEEGPTGRVVWLQSDPVLPSLQQYMILDVDARDGVTLGDQFTLHLPVRDNEIGLRVPEEKIATVQVVRVTDYGASALVIGHVQPAIKEGTRVRMTARMP